MQNPQIDKSESSIRTNPRKPGEIVFSLLLIFFGALGYYFGMDITSGELSSPSVAPKVASVVIMAMGGIEFFRVLKKQSVPVNPVILVKYLFTWDVLVILLLLSLYTVLLPVLHFSVASFLFLLASLLYLQRGKNLMLCGGIAVGSVALLVLIFTYIFKVQLP